MSKKKFDPKESMEKFLVRAAVLRRYSFIIFLVFVTALYGFLLFRIDTLSNEQPTQDAITNQVKAAAIPHIDEKVVEQLQSLQDNSVNVKTLFNQARSNPFQE